MKNVYIIDAKRTAVGTFGGALANTDAVKLGTTVAKNILAENNLDGTEIDEMLLGCVLQAGLGQNVARQVAIGSGLPDTKTAMTVNMVCGSGLRTVALAAQAIKAGDADLIIAGGTENMSMAPYLLPKARTGYRMGHGNMIDSMINEGLWDVFNDYHMGITAENLAEKYNLTREDQDAFATTSQNRAEAAINSGRFANEIVPVVIPQRKKDPIIFATDEFPRAGVTAAGLAKLRPAFKKDGTVTAANSSGINDGAAMILVASEEAVQKYNLKPMAKIVSYGYHGTDPAIMGFGPVEAVRLALKKADWKLEDVELIEANEAFAAQSLSVMKELNMNPEITNVNGGALAIGHPIGASGARILVTLLHEMQKRKVTKGLATLCIGGGMGIAVCVERV